MIPPLARRCPECGHTGSSGQFGVVPREGGRRRIECPACGYRFDPPDDGWRN